MHQSLLNFFTGTKLKNSVNVREKALYFKKYEIKYDWIDRFLGLSARDRGIPLCVNSMNILYKIWK